VNLRKRGHAVAERGGHFHAERRALDVGYVAGSCVRGEDGKCVAFPSWDEVGDGEDRGVHVEDADTWETGGEDDGGRARRERGREPENSEARQRSDVHSAATVVHPRSTARTPAPCNTTHDNNMRHTHAFTR